MLITYISMWSQRTLLRTASLSTLKVVGLPLKPQRKNLPESWKKWRADFRDERIRRCMYWPSWNELCRGVIITERWAENVTVCMFAVPNTALIHSATRTRTWRDFPCFERTCCLRYREHILLSIASLLRLVATGFSGLSCTLSSYFPEAGVGAECAVIGV